MRRAKNPTERGFNSYDKRRLTRALRTVEDARTYRRMQAVLGVAQSRTVQAVAEIAGVQSWAVYAWIRTYLHAHRSESLRDAPRSGRPRASAAITDERIRREVRRDPTHLGYNSTGWTVSLLADHLHQTYGTAICARTLRRRMHELGLRWKRPRYRYANKDPNRTQKKGALFAA